MYIYVLNINILMNIIYFPHFKLFWRIEKIIIKDLILILRVQYLEWLIKNYIHLGQIKRFRESKKINKYLIYIMKVIDNK